MQAELIGIEAGPERETEVDGEGWIYDVATGEVLGRLDAPEAFRVDTEAAAEWALELRSRIEGEIAGVDARTRALLAQLEALRAEKARRLAWWEWRFRDDLVAFARSRLAGKARTWRCAWGKVAFRSTKGATEIIDMGAAVEWCRAWLPEAVQTKTWVTATAAREAVEAASRATGEDERPAFLATAGPGESVTVSTGIEQGGKP